MKLPHQPALRALLAFAGFLFASVVQAQCPRPANGSIAANPNRPTIADPADITQFGVLEAEYGYEHVAARAKELENNLGGLLKFAVACDLEIRWDTDSLLHRSSPGETDTGTGDNWLGFQYRFHRQSRYAPSLAFGYSLKFPSASVSKGFGNGFYDHQFKFLASKDLRGFHFDYNVSGFRVGRPGGADNNVEMNLAFSHRLRGKLQFTGEFYGDTELNPQTPSYTSGLWAFTYAITPWLVVDAGMDHALAAGAPFNRRVFAGVTYSIADLYAGHRRSKKK
jgi:Putative MetA-pathway of phenol degradation